MLDWDSRHAATAIEVAEVVHMSREAQPNERAQELPSQELSSLVGLRGRLQLVKNRKKNEEGRLMCEVRQHVV
jgi:hypothetical protein